MAEGGSPSTPRESPPKAVIDTSPLHIDQNKECKRRIFFNNLELWQSFFLFATCQMRVIFFNNVA